MTDRLFSPHSVNRQPLMILLLACGGVAGVSACTDKNSAGFDGRATTTSPTDSGATGDSVIGWQDYVQSVADEFEATGLCPTEPPAEVAAIDGSMYIAEPHVGDVDSAYSEGRYGVWSWLVGAEWSSVGPAKVLPCGSPGQADAYHPVGDQVGVAVWSSSTGSSLPLPPRFISSLDEGGSKFHGAQPRLNVHSGGSSVTIRGSTDSETSSYMWVCIESFTGAAEYTEGPAEFRGSLFVHVEEWMLDGGGTFDPSLADEPVPKDFFFKLGPVDCSSGEDAGWDKTDCYNWDQVDCDGIDNDLDGVIDEASTTGMDQDGNSVLDCMDDWDGDGVPNHEDPDLNSGDCE